MNNQYIKEAQKAGEAGNFEEAMKIYNQEIIANPKNVHIRESKVRCLMKLKRHLEAIESCQNILSLDSKNITAYTIMAEALFALRRFTESKETIRKAYSINPDSVIVLVSYSTLLLYEGKIEEATGLLEKVITLDGNNYTAYRNLASIYALKRNRKRLLYCAKEIYRLEKTTKNAIRLFIAKMDYYRITNILFVSSIIMTIVAEILQQWGFFFLGMSFLGILLALRIYLKK